MVHLEQSRVLPADTTRTYDTVLPIALEDLMGRRYLALPGLASVEQDRPWGQEVGQTRVLHFTDGGRATEVLSVLERPDRFGYDLVDLRGPLTLLGRSVHGVWSFVPESPATTRVTWTWDVDPTPLGRVLLPVFGAMWRGMAARCLADLGRRLGEHL